MVPDAIYQGNLFIKAMDNSCVLLSWDRPHAVDMSKVEVINIVAY